MEFKDKETAEKNFDILKECQFDGRSIFVDHASTRATSDSSISNIGN